jgi:hypothetical protein
MSDRLKKKIDRLDLAPSPLAKNTNLHTLLASLRQKSGHISQTRRIAQRANIWRFQCKFYDA